MEDSAGSISFHQESHVKGRSGNEDGVGMCHPCQVGLGPTDGCFSLWAVRLSCLFQSQFASFSTLVSFSVEVRKAKYLGLEGRIGWSKGWGKAGSWGKARAAWLDSPPGWPRPAEGPPASNPLEHVFSNPA